MTNADLLKAVLEMKSFLPEKQQKFIMDLKAQAFRNYGLLRLTGAQEQYLQSCYDKAVSAKYGVEPMSTDRETAAKRAAKKAREA